MMRLGLTDKVLCKITSLSEELDLNPCLQFPSSYLNHCISVPPSLEMVKGMADWKQAIIMQKKALTKGKVVEARMRAFLWAG